MTSLDILVTVFIITLVLFTAWRVGQRNPVGTGGLAGRLAKVEGQVAEVDARLGGVEKSTADLARSGAATVTQIEVLRAEFAGDRKVNEKTFSVVDRMQMFFMEAGAERITNQAAGK